MIQVFDCAQGSPEWFECRRGVPTASKFSTILAKGVGGQGDSVTRRKYLYQLAAEILTGEALESYSNHHMERGKAMEDEARRHYAFMTDDDPESVGFIRNGSKGCSPDSRISKDGLLEIKTKLPDILIDVLKKDKVPPEHVAQCQGALWVAEREWIDFVAYWPKMPIFIKRLYRDEDYIKKLSSAVDAFNDELEQVVAEMRALRGEPSFHPSVILKNQLVQSIAAE